MFVEQQIGDQRPASPTGPASSTDTGTGKAPVPTLGAVIRDRAAVQASAYTGAGSRAGRRAGVEARRNMNIIMGKARGRIK